MMFVANPMAKAVNLAVLTIFLAGCSAMDSMHESPDYNRHSMSQLSQPLDGATTADFFWFDVKLSPEYPGNNATAEAIRMQWLSSWLEVRKACLNGYEIIERREFGFTEHNPARYDLRYKVQCKVLPPVGVETDVTD
jgi:hypothetical protein